MRNYINIGKIDRNKIGKYGNKVITDEVILTNERLNNHILEYHKDEYEQIKLYIKEIVENPDLIIEETHQKNTLILLKDIKQINKKARIVIKLAVNKEERIYNKNSIITIMRQRDKSWEQTIKNKGQIIFKKLDKNE